MERKYKFRIYWISKGIKVDVSLKDLTSSLFSLFFGFPDLNRLFFSCHQNVFKFFFTHIPTNRFLIGPSIFWKLNTCNATAFVLSFFLCTFFRHKLKTLSENGFSKNNQSLWLSVPFLKWRSQFWSRGHVFYKIWRRINAGFSIKHILPRNLIWTHGRRTIWKHCLVSFVSFRQVFQLNFTLIDLLKTNWDRKRYKCWFANTDSTLMYSRA